MSQPCRRCNGTEHYVREIYDNDNSGLNVLKPGFFTAGKLTAQVCGTCGLIELVVPERFLSSVREKFQKLP